MTKNEMKMITDWLIENIVMNPEIMYPDAIRTAGEKNEVVTTPKGSVTLPTAIDLVAVIVYLHNRLYEEITGEPYNYSSTGLIRSGATSMMKKICRTVNM